MRVLSILAGALLVGSAFAHQDFQPKLGDALAWLDKVKSGFSPNVQADVPAIRAILTRYFNDPGSLRASEEEIATTFLKTVPDPNGIGSRGGGEDRMKDFDALMGGGGGGGSSSSGGGHSKPKPKPKPHPVPEPHHKIPGIHSKPVFTAHRVSAPGGKKIGSVTISSNGSNKTVIEILTPAANYDVYQRAQVVAARMQRIARSNRLWWTTLKVSQVKGQYVVGPARGSEFIITADDAFAKEWGVSTQQLAKQLVVKIRTAVDAEESENFGGRSTTSDDLRMASIDLRQQGDSLFGTDAKAAEEKYQLAIQNDPTYAVPYLRLADIYVARNDSKGAKELLSSALNVEGMSADQKATLSAKLKALGG